MAKTTATQQITIRGGVQYTPTSPPPESRRRVNKGTIVTPPDTPSEEPTPSTDTE